MSQIIKCLLEKAGISYEVECGTDWNINTSYYNDLILSPALQCDKLINVLLECISDINDFFENNSCETDFWYIEDSDILNKGLNFLAMMINRIRLKKQLIQKNDLNQNITIQDLIINILASTLYIKLVLLKGSLVYNIFQISLINKIIDNIYYICKNGHLVQGNENRLENTFILKYKDKSKSQRTTRSRKFSYDFLEKIDDNLFTDKRLPSKSLNNIQHFWISCNDPETKHILLNSLCQFLSSWNFFYTKNDNKVQNLIDSTDYFENGNKMNMTTFREESTLEIRILHLMAIRKFVYGNVETLVSKTNEQAKIYVSKIDDLIFEVFYNYCLNPLVFTTNDDSTSQNHLIDSLERRFRHLFDLLEEDMVKNDKNTSCLFFTKLYIERILLYLSHLKEIIPSYSEPGASVLDRIFQKQLYILSQNLTLNRLENCNNCVSQLFAQSMSIKAKIKYVIWMARLSKAVDADLVSASADMVNCFIRNGCLLNANSESGSLLNESNLNDPLVYCLKPAYLLRIIMMGSMHEKSASVRGKFLSCLLKYFERYLNHAASLKELLEPCLDKSESKSKETLKEPIFCASEEYLEINQSVLDDCIHTNEPLSITEMLIREYTSQNPVTKNNAEESVVPTGDSAMDEISPHINERENFENELRSKFASFSELCTLSSLISYPTNKETESILTNGITFRHILALLNIRMTQEPTAHVRRMAIEITGKLVSFSMLNLSDKTFRGQISHLTEHNNDVNQDNAHESMTSDDYDRTKIYVPEILKLLDFYQIIPVLLEASLHDKTMMVRKQAICSLTAIITQIMPHIDSESSSNMAPLLLDWIKTLLICFFDQNLSSKGSGLNEKCLDIAERHILGPIFFDRGEKEVNDLAWKIIDSLINNIICFIPFTFAKTHDSYDSDKANVINKIDVCHKNALYFTVPSNSPWRNMFQSLFAAFTLKFKDANSINTRLLKKSHLTANLSYYKERLFLMHIICRLQPHSYIQIIKDSLKTSGNLDDIVHSLKLITDQYIGKELATLLRYHKIKTNLSSPFLEKKDDRIGETLSGNNESYLIDALGLIKYYLVCLTTFVISLKGTTDKTNLVIWIFGLVTTVSQQLGQMLGGYGWQNVSLCTALIEVIKSINSLFPGIFATLFKKRDDRRESNSELSNQHSISYYDESIQLPYRTMSELVIACRKRLEQFLTGNGEGGEKISEEDGPISEEQSVIKSLVMLGEIIILYPEFLDKTLCYIVLSLVISNDDKNNGSIFDKESDVKNPENYSFFHIRLKEKLATGTEKITSNTETSKLLSISSPFENMPFESRTSNAIRAHAFVVLGKFCLKNEAFAKQCLPAFIYELAVMGGFDLSNKDDNHMEDREGVEAIRNNVILILMDYIKKYPSMADPYVTKITHAILERCNDTGISNDSWASLTRYQSLSSLMNLIRESHILTGRDQMLLKFLPLLVDNDLLVKNLAITNLVPLISMMGSKQSRRNDNFFNSRFLDIVYYLNGLDDKRHEKSLCHSNKFETLLENFDITISNRRGPAIHTAGNDNFEKRMEIYEICLSHLKNDHKFLLTARVCSNILSPAVYTLPHLIGQNDVREDNATSNIEKLEIMNNVIRDAFYLLSCPSNQPSIGYLSGDNTLSSSKKGKRTTANKRFKNQDHADVSTDPDDSAYFESPSESTDGLSGDRMERVELTRKGMINEILKKNIMENVLPVLANLKQTLEKCQSSLMKYLKEYLDFITKTFPEELDEMFSNHPELLEEMEPLQVSKKKKKRS